MTDAELLDELGPVVLATVPPMCMVPTTLRLQGEDVPDDSEVVRPAAPLDATAAAQIREQQIARLQRDDAAIAAREARIRGSRSNVAPFRRRA